MREIAAERRDFGYRRIGVMLESEGIVDALQELRRLYKKEGLVVKPNRGRTESPAPANPCRFRPPTFAAGSPAPIRRTVRSSYPTAPHH